jgi:hypothetical protein
MPSIKTEKKLGETLAEDGESAECEQLKRGLMHWLRR